MAKVQNGEEILLKVLSPEKWAHERYRETNSRAIAKTRTSRSHVRVKMV